MIKNTTLLLVLALGLAACGPGRNSPMNSAAVRTVGGAAVGALVADKTGGSKTKGALIGAVAGGVSCVNGSCY
ncbi:hypothetical protein JCM7686_pAMI4p090 (plasmid) [Paracoccus aminophilus JCM 7686]|uniref:17 kDa surface antigen n=2 Tax=Paracoccus aminophilus TaxID=34003 RepID=S5YZZ6_PARAH|nr:hypothetical protein JCM7686_pAMI4p090 [Paracoccus aminophilus JCM 7686]